VFIEQTNEFTGTQALESTGETIRTDPRVSTLDEAGAFAPDTQVAH